MHRQLTVAVDAFRAGQRQPLVGSPEALALLYVRRAPASALAALEGEAF